MDDTFKTIEKKCNGIYKEKGSSFLSYIYPIFDESEVKLILLALKKEHPKARHICYAYRVGFDKSFFKLNDDGEPAGTAGKPILGQLNKYSLENVIIAVVRYFGGTLLGVGGLSVAYKTAAQEAIINATIVSKNRSAYFEIEFDYPTEKLIEAFCKKHAGSITDKSYQQTIKAQITFPISKLEIISSILNQYFIENQWPVSPKLNYSHKDNF